MVQANYQQEQQTQFNEVEAEQEADNSASPFDIYRELSDLAEIVISGSHVPFTELIVCNGDLLLEQLDLIRANLPLELDTAIAIVDRQQEIISEAEAYACLTIKSAQEKANKVVQESAIVRQAELEGAKIRLQIEQECEQLKHSTVAEVEEIRQQAIAECRAIQADADNYADDTLEDIEQRLQNMLTIVQNGRQQIAQTSAE